MFIRYSALWRINISDDWYAQVFLMTTNAVPTFVIVGCWYLTIHCCVVAYIREREEQIMATQPAFAILS